MGARSSGRDAVSGGLALHLGLRLRPEAHAPALDLGFAPLVMPDGRTVGMKLEQSLGNLARPLSDAQLEAGALQRELQLDNPTVSIEQTMIAMNKIRM